jgi:hypothetical protein
VKEGDEGYWQVLFISCKTGAAVSFKVKEHVRFIDDDTNQYSDI